jgi:predicted AAA+ superfamily ATPase
MADMMFHDQYWPTALKESRERFAARDPGVPREKLMAALRSQKAPYATVITGVRRSGKSTFLRQVAAPLKGAFHFLNFEDLRLRPNNAQDLQHIHQLLIEQDGLQTTFLIDEIQHVPHWDQWVRTLLDRQFKVCLTGSNASLLSRELGTALTGRHYPIELFPLNFKEYLAYRKIEAATAPDTRQSAMLAKALESYLVEGGMPEQLTYPELEPNRRLLQDILYRDIAQRFHITHTRELEELTFQLFSNISNAISFTKLKNQLGMGSLNTVKLYIHHLADAWLYLTVRRYSPSTRLQLASEPKGYAIDTGLAREIGFRPSPNYGADLENSAFLHLRSIHPQVFYYRTRSNCEVDFFIPRVDTFVQVCWKVGTQETRDRELRSLEEARNERNRSRLLLVTQTPAPQLKAPKHVEVIPPWKFFLNPDQFCSR